LIQGRGTIIEKIGRVGVQAERFVPKSNLAGIIFVLGSKPNVINYALKEALESCRAIIGQLVFAIIRIVYWSEHKLGSACILRPIIDLDRSGSNGKIGSSHAFERWERKACSTAGSGTI
jgi:hypothetical protein